MIKSIPQLIKSDLNNYKKLLKSKGINVAKIILFGSVAKGVSDKHSDIDVAVVSSSFGKDYHKEMVRLMILANKINNSIEPHPFNPNDLDNKYNALANEIKKHGILVK